MDALMVFTGMNCHLTVFPSGELPPVGQTFDGTSYFVRLRQKSLLLLAIARV